MLEISFVAAAPCTSLVVVGVVEPVLQRRVQVAAAALLALRLEVVHRRTLAVAAGRSQEHAALLALIVGGRWVVEVLALARMAAK